MLGDSTAAGQGVHRAGQTPGALLASGLAAVAERPVELRNVALPGAQSDDLDRQVALALADPARVPGRLRDHDRRERRHPPHAARPARCAICRRRYGGCARPAREVVVGTCPDLGTVEPVQQPLRWLARRASRQLAAAQTIGAVEQGGRTVSLGDLLGPEFEANPRELFGPDNYHPSAEGYATAAMAVLPTRVRGPGPVAGGGGAPGRLPPRGLPAGGPGRRGGGLGGGHGGHGGDADGPRGPWALLKRRADAGGGAGADEHATRPPVRPSSEDVRRPQDPAAFEEAGAQPVQPAGGRPSPSGV